MQTTARGTMTRFSIRKSRGWSSRYDQTCRVFWSQLRVYTSRFLSSLNPTLNFMNKVALLNRLMFKRLGTTHNYTAWASSNYHVVAAYETKAMNWPEVKAEDGQALNRFAIFLMRCKNAMECSKNLTKLEQPETIKKLVLKLPFSLRVRWHRLVDEIMEDQRWAIRFNDLTEFLDHEARVATNTLFGKIVADFRPRPDTRRSLLNPTRKRKKDIGLGQT